MKVAPVASDTGVKLLVGEIKTKAELIAVKGKLSLQVHHHESRRDIGECFTSVIHPGPSEATDEC
jgi:hypothetical protein